MKTYTIQTRQGEYVPGEAGHFLISFLKEAESYQNIIFKDDSGTPHKLPFNRFFKEDSSINDQSYSTLPDEIKAQIFPVRGIHPGLYAINQLEENTELVEHLSNIAHSIIRDPFTINVFKYKLFKSKLFFKSNPFQNPEELNYCGNLCIVTFQGSHNWCRKVPFHIMDSDTFYSFSKKPKMIGPSWFLSKFYLCNEQPYNSNQWKCFQHPRSLEAYFINDFLTDSRLNVTLRADQRKRLVSTVRR